MSYVRLLSMLALSASGLAANFPFTIRPVKLHVNQIEVLFKRNLPPESDITVKGRWRVTLTDGGGTTREIPVSVVGFSSADYVAKQHVILQADAPSEVIFKDEFTVKVALNYGDPDQGRDAAQYPSAPWESCLKDRKDCDIFLSGIWVTGVHATPHYTIDSTIRLAFPLNHTAQDRLGVFGDVKTDNQTNLDPNSFRFGALYEHLLLQKRAGSGWETRLVWNLVEMEDSRFSSPEHTRNIITSPFIWPSYQKPLAGTSVTLRLDLRAGSEFGSNVASPFVTVKVGPKFVAREFGDLEVAAVRGSDDHPLTRLVRTVKLDGEFQIRELSTAETIVRHVRDVKTQKLTDQVDFVGGSRVYGKVGLSFGIGPYTSLAVSFEGGSLPPAFRIVDSKVTVTLQFGIRHTP